MSYTASSIRFRAIVAAWREDSEGECVEGRHVERVVCVEVDKYPDTTLRQRARDTAQAVMQATYPEVNQFDIYNIENERDDPAAVLGYVTGFGGNRQRYEANPIVAFRTPNPDPAKHREPDAGTWAEYLAEEDAKRADWPKDFPPHGRGLRNLKT